LRWPQKTRPKKEKR
jgi:transposase